MGIGEVIAIFLTINVPPGLKGLMNTSLRAEIKNFFVFKLLLSHVILNLLRF